MDLNHRRLPSSDLQSDAIDRSATDPFYGATSRNRTSDQRFTKPPLYQLSYSGAKSQKAQKYNNLFKLCK